MRYIAVEFRKILATRFFPIMVFCSFFFGAFFTGLLWLAITSGAGDGQAETARIPEISLAEAYAMPGGLIYMLALVSGVIFMTTEFRHRTISRTLQTGVSRGFLVFAKMCATTAFTTFLAVGTALFGGAAFALVLNLKGKRDPELFGDDFYVALGMTVLVFIVWGLIGIGAALLIRNQVAAITSLLVFTLILEPLISWGLLSLKGAEPVRLFLPTELTKSVLNHIKFNAEPLVLGWQYSFLTLFAIGIVLILIGFFVNFRRRSFS